MIKKVKVDGFKSLSGFELNLKPGLNILVGPNGAGKSNIVLFFEFLSHLVSGELSEALSKVGGAGSILRKIGSEEYHKNIDVEIYGRKKIKKNKYLDYIYIFKIELSQHNLIYFKEQSLKLFVKNKNLSKRRKEWVLDIKQIVTKDLKPKIDILKYNIKKFRPYIFPDKMLLKNQAKSLETFLERNNLLLNSIVSAITSVLDFDYSLALISDLKGGETFNIIPSRVKEIEDVAKPPGIQKDGSGLAATLYAMKMGQSRYKERDLLVFRRFDFPRHLSEDTYNPKNLKKIIENVKLANNSINNIDVENEPFGNSLNVKIYINEGTEEAVLPLSAMSDGTIKWMTLITIILTCRTIFCIEEPENFLHPWMQAEIVKLMRNVFRSENRNFFIIMTTHSESLVNFAKPDEIIVVSMKEGKTYAKRIKNINILKQEIAKTGFGLGYYYFSNALEYE